MNRIILAMLVASLSPANAEDVAPLNYVEAFKQEDTLLVYERRGEERRIHTVGWESEGPRLTQKVYFEGAESMRVNGDASFLTNPLFIIKDGTIDLVNFESNYLPIETLDYQFHEITMAITGESYRAMTSFAIKDAEGYHFHRKSKNNWVDWQPIPHSFESFRRFTTGFLGTKSSGGLWQLFHWDGTQFEPVSLPGEASELYQLGKDLFSVRITEKNEAKYYHCHVIGEACQLTSQFGGAQKSIKLVANSYLLTGNSSTSRNQLFLNENTTWVNVSERFEAPLNITVTLLGDRMLQASSRTEKQVGDWRESVVSRIFFFQDSGGRWQDLQASIPGSPFFYQLKANDAGTIIAAQIVADPVFTKRDPEWYFYQLVGSKWVSGLPQNLPTKLTRIWNTKLLTDVIGLQDFGDSNANGEFYEWSWFLRVNDAWVPLARIISTEDANVQSVSYNHQLGSLEIIDQQDVKQFFLVRDQVGYQVF